VCLLEGKQISHYIMAWFIFICIYFYGTFIMCLSSYKPYSIMLRIWNSKGSLGTLMQEYNSFTWLVPKELCCKGQKVMRVQEHSRMQS
jgi:hypothetical protein